MKKIVIVLVILLAIAVGIYFLQQPTQQSESQNKPTKVVKSINSFDECTDAGYPVRESYPPQCSTPEGKTFIQEIGNELKYSDEIRISSPRPNQVITSPLRIAGEARGSWFFEAYFSVELFDDTNQSLAEGFVQAQKEWMTENFVPFKGEILFQKPATARGKLIIKNANASGLPENDKELIIPVVF